MQPFCASHLQDLDALSTLAEETKDAKNTLPKAMILTTLIAGVVFIISTYFMQLYFPNHPETYFKLIDETQPEILEAVGGAVFKAVVLGFAIVTVMASGNLSPCRRFSLDVCDGS